MVGIEFEENLDNNYSVEINEYEDAYVINSFYSEILASYSKEQLLQYITYPMRYHKQLMEISEKMYNRNGIYGQTITKMVSSPSLDSVIIPSDTQKSKVAHEKAYSIMNDKINHKLSTRDGIWNSLIYGEYVALLRDTKKNSSAKRPSVYATGDKIESFGSIDNVMLQPLDLKYCRFEGFANGDYVVSFDLQYFDMFLKSGTLVGEIKNYPKEFLTGYKLYRKDSSKRWLLLPQEKTFAYKYHGAINESHGRPLVVQAILDILFSEDYTDSQRNNMSDNASTIRWMRLPESDKKGSCSLNKEQQANQYNAFKNAVKSNDNRKRQRLGGTTTLKLAPGTEIGKLDNDNTFLSNTLTNENNNSISTSLGFPISALNGGNTGTNFSTLSISINLMLSEVFSILEQFSFQYTKLLNNYLGLNDKNKISFNYLNTSTLNSDEEYKKYKELYTLAGGSRLMLYSCVSGNSKLYVDLCRYEEKVGLNNMPVHPTSYTMSSSDSFDNANPNDNTGGRPPKSLSELSVDGEKTRNNNANNIPSPSKL